MESFAEIWNYPLFSLTTGGDVTVSQVVLAVLLVVGGLWLGFLMQRALGPGAGQQEPQIRNVAHPVRGLHHVAEGVGSAARPSGRGSATSTSGGPVGNAN